MGCVVLSTVLRTVISRISFVFVESVSLCRYNAGRHSAKAPSTPVTVSKQHCRMRQVERFFRQYGTMSNEISSFRQSRNELNMYVQFVSIDQVECCFDVVAGVDGA